MWWDCEYGQTNLCFSFSWVLNFVFWIWKCKIRCKKAYIFFVIWVCCAKQIEMIKFCMFSELFFGTTLLKSYDFYNTSQNMFWYPLANFFEFSENPRKWEYMSQIFLKIPYPLRLHSWIEPHVMWKVMFLDVDINLYFKNYSYKIETFFFYLNAKINSKWYVCT